MREHVLAASKHILAGDWSKASNLILKLEVWKLLPADGGERVKEMLQVKIKEEALRTYLLTHGLHYEVMALFTFTATITITVSITNCILDPIITG